MVSRSAWYKRVNEVFSGGLPPLTAVEAVRAARKMWRWGMSEKCPYPIKITSGHRYNWLHGDGCLYVNPDKGWDRLAHDMSHLMWQKANPTAKPHEKGHAKFELRLRVMMLKRGWLSGTLKDLPKPEKPAIDPKVAKYQRVMARIEGWMAKKRRAENALRKLARARKYYERNLQLTA